MKKACYFPVHESLNGNKIFEIANNLCKNGDWRLYYPHILKKKLADLKYDLSTPDINSPTKSEFTIYATIPKNLDQINKKKSILLLTETEAINKRDWDFKLHKYFNHIFTYKKLGDPKYIEFYDCPFNFEEVHFSKPINNKEILIVCSNKRSVYPNQLYTYRYRLIKWFEKNYSSSFRLYGEGWDKPPVYVNSRHNINLERIHHLFKSKLNLYKMPIVNKKVYKGITKNKYKLLKEYDFNFALQNTFTKDHFLSPIFESFYCSSIPLYLGAKNVEDYIPENCFIDLRKFANFRKVLNYILSLNYENILEYKKNIHKYLIENNHKKFTSEFQIKKIITTISS